MIDRKSTDHAADSDASHPPPVDQSGNNSADDSPGVADVESNDESEIDAADDSPDADESQSPSYAGPQFTLSTLLKGVTGIAFSFGLLKILPFFGIAGLLAIASMFVVPRPKPHPNGIPRAAWPIAGALLGLASWVVGLISPAVPIFWIVLAARRSYVGMALLGFTCPAGFPTLLAATSYFTGNATIQTMGDPGTEYFNIDPDYRCRRVTVGARYSGNLWLRIPPHNQVVRLLIRSFGPMKGAYTGPYPNRFEAYSIAVDGLPIDPETFENGTVDVRGETTRLHADTVRRLKELGLFAAPPPTVATTSVPPLAGIWNGRCLLIWIPAKPTPFAPIRPTTDGGVAVIDRETGLCFAVFDHNSDRFTLRDAVNWGQVR